MKDVIKVQFVKDCKASGREYTYYTPKAVEVGDLVDVETNHGVTQAVVSRINVPLEEIARFGDNAKSIIGKTACRCEECEQMEDDNGDGTATRACQCAESRFPVLLNMRTDDYLWCMGCYFQKRGGTDGTSSHSPAPVAKDGQQMFFMPQPASNPWDFS